MKTFKVAIIVLIVLLVLIVINSIYIKRLTDEIAKRVEAVDISSENAEENFKEICAYFKKSERFISITVSHDDLTNIEEAFSDIIGAAMADSEIDMTITKSRLTDALRHLGQLSSINLDSII